MAFGTEHRKTWDEKRITFKRTYMYIYIYITCTVFVFVRGTLVRTGLRVYIYMEKMSLNTRLACLNGLLFFIVPSVHENGRPRKGKRRRKSVVRPVVIFVFKRQRGGPIRGVGVGGGDVVKSPPTGN